MNIKIQIIVFCFVACFCQTVNCQNQQAGNKINIELFNKLETMAKSDQHAASNAFPPEGYKHLSQEQWEAYKDSVYRTHKAVLEQIIANFGFPGYDLVGKNGEHYFWLLVQHCDFAPDFQKKVLEMMEIEIKKGNASRSHFALLTDRVLLNTGQKQLFGTQVFYDNNKAYPKNLADSIHVNKRRAEMGLEPIEDYLNQLTRNHIQRNKL